MHELYHFNAAIITFRAVDDRDHLEVETSDLKSKVATLERDAKELRAREVADRDLEFELEQVRKKLEKAEEVKDDHYRLKQNYETLKHTCLELQDQVADYDRLTEKLEKSIVEARSASDAAKKEASENAEMLAKLKVERNELKSSVIYAETQLREMKAKHDDVEQLFRREEDEWTRRIDRANTTKLEQSESLEQVRSQMAALAKNYDIVSAESKGLKEQNFRLKEETSAMTTNIRDAIQ